MHGDNDQMLAWHMLQQIAHKLQLPVAEPSGIASVAGRIRLATSIVDIVEYDEGRLAVLEGIVARTKDTFPSLAGIVIRWATGLPRG